MTDFKYKVYTYTVRSGIKVGTSSFTEEERLELIALLNEAENPPKHLLESLEERPHELSTRTQLYFYYDYEA